MLERGVVEHHDDAVVDSGRAVSDALPRVLELRKWNLQELHVRLRCQFSVDSCAELVGSRCRDVERRLAGLALFGIDRGDLPCPPAAGKLDEVGECRGRSYFALVERFDFHERVPGRVDRKPLLEIGVVLNCQHEHGPIRGIPLDDLSLVASIGLVESRERPVAQLQGRAG